MGLPGGHWLSRCDLIADSCFYTTRHGFIGIFLQQSCLICHYISARISAQMSRRYNRCLGGFGPARWSSIKLFTLHCGVSFRAFYYVLTIFLVSRPCCLSRHNVLIIYCAWICRCTNRWLGKFHSMAGSYFPPLNQKFADAFSIELLVVFSSYLGYYLVRSFVSSITTGLVNVTP